MREAVDGVDDDIVLRQIKSCARVAVVGDGPGFNLRIGMNFEQAGFERLDFQLSNRFGCGLYLAVDIGLADHVVIHQRQLPQAGPDQRLAAPAADAADAEYNHMRIAQALQCV